MASFESINYALRPSKQVERKLIIEALQRISKAGYFLNEYTYLGLGSVYYADFVLFHKYLLVEDMLCAEIEDVPKRMAFNKPYKFIDLHMKPVDQVFPLLDRNKKHMVWLDFDTRLDTDRLSDIRSCLQVLAPGSIFIVTVSADAINHRNLIDPVLFESLTPEESRKEIVKELDASMSEHVGRTITRSDLNRSALPVLYATILQNFTKLCLDSRGGMKLFQLFNFKYADNLQMLSFGGIVDVPGKENDLNECGVYDLEFVTNELNPIQISVPPITIREKSWMEQHLVSNATPPDLEFELKPSFVENFVKYYRHYPAYFESLT